MNTPLGSWPRLAAAGLHQAILLTSMACAAIAIAQAPPKPLPQLDFGSTTANPVRIQTSLRNGSGQVANDFHADVSSKDSQGITGAGVDAGVFPNQAIARTGPNSFSIDLSGANVPPNGTMDIDIVAWLKQMNQLRFNWNWTFDGNNIGGRPGIDFDVGGPRAGGGGGIPPRQGGGGGGGNFIHPFTFVNSGDKPLEILGVSYFASMDYFGDMAAMPWADIPAVFTGRVTLLPQEEWSTVFETTGSYAQGNIYFKLLLVDDEVEIYGAHPVIPEPKTWAMLAGLGLAGFAVGRRMHAQRAGRGSHRGPL